MTNYHSIELGYDLPQRSRSFSANGPGVMMHVSMGTEDDEVLDSETLLAAEKVYEAACKKLGLESVHEYAWPGDGDFYQIIRSHLSEQEIKDALEAEGCRVIKFWPREDAESTFNERWRAPKDQPVI